jgi:outer membrane scaffolding protein for murein synthesis (MipA/OmpV family)
MRPLAGDSPMSRGGSRPFAGLLRHALLFSGCLLMLVSAPARGSLAQTPSPLANWQYSAGVVLAPLGGPVPEWRITLGAAGAVMPKYEGASSYEAEPGALIDIRYRDLAFLSAGEGLGVNVLRGQTYRAGLAVSYDLGRDDGDDPRLRGLGDISPAPEAKLFAQVSILPVVLTADVRGAIGGHDGWIADFGAYMPLSRSKTLVAFAGPSVTVADSNYMQSYFGVDAGQSARSGLRRFEADSGVKNANFGATALYSLSDHWLVVGDAAVEQLLDDAAESPITQNNTQFTIDVSLAYSF